MVHFAKQGLSQLYCLGLIISMFFSLIEIRSWIVDGGKEID